MRVLAVGIATLDVICWVDRYPAEDAEVRAQGVTLCRGGNATNSLVALATLGHHCSWAGTMVDEPDSRFIYDDLSRHGVDYSHVHQVEEGKTPTSYILSSAETGSRTIVHYRDLPEYPATAFEKIDLTHFDWIHFEGRNIESLTTMLHKAAATEGLQISLEVEKARGGLETLFHLPDVLLFSRAYAQNRGFESGRDFLAQLGKEISAIAYCAWGAEGGVVRMKSGALSSSPSFPPKKVVDTLGAGDVFNAGVLHGLMNGLSEQDALLMGCKLAGYKCGHEGIGCLKQWATWMRDLSDGCSPNYQAQEYCNLLNS
jgi:ketohexokinase